MIGPTVAARRTATMKPGPAHRHAWAATMLVSAAFVAPSSLARAAPPEDCAKAGSTVATALCESRDGSGGDLGWLADTMARMEHLLHASLPASAEAGFATDQTRWLQSRDACHGGRDAVIACLSGSYRRRLIELSERFVGRGTTGLYRRRFGELEMVALPGGTVAFDIESNRGPPDYNMCSLQGSLRLLNGHARYVTSVGDGSAAQPERCRVDFEHQGSGFSVASEGCSYFCGYGASVDGLYEK